MIFFPAHRSIFSIAGLVAFLIGALSSCATPSPVAVSFPQGGNSLYHLS